MHKDQQLQTIFTYIRGNENRRKKVSVGGPVLHPSLVRSYQQVLRPFFEDELLCGQNLLETKEKFEKILEMIPDEAITAKLRGEWQGNHRSSNSKEDINCVRWEKLKNHLQSSKPKWLRRCVEAIVFPYTYPRLDMGVTKHTNQLLKAPFCVHPKTGCACVPIDPHCCEEFDPMAVPTLSTLLEELNKGGSRDLEFSGTSLGESVGFFRSSFLEPLLKSCKEKMQISYKAKLQQSKSSSTW